MKKLQYPRHYTLQNFVNNFVLNLMHLKNFFNHINNFHRNIKFTMEEESNAELAFLDTSLDEIKDLFIGI